MQWGLQEASKGKTEHLPQGKQLEGGRMGIYHRSFLLLFVFFFFFFLAGGIETLPREKKEMEKRYGLISFFLAGFFCPSTEARIVFAVYN